MIFRKYLYTRATHNTLKKYNYRIFASYLKSMIFGKVHKAFEGNNY